MRWSLITLPVGHQLQLKCRFIYFGSYLLLIGTFQQGVDNHSIRFDQCFAIGKFAPQRSTSNAGEWAYVTDVRRNHHPWIRAQVLRRHGKVLYEVSVGPRVWIRHANQTRKLFNFQENTSNGRSLDDWPVDYSLENERNGSTHYTANSMVPLSDQTKDVVKLNKNPTQSTVDPVMPLPDQTRTIPRHSTRVSRPPRRIQIDPSKRSYQ